jgi:hypothetical protein
MLSQIELSEKKTVVDEKTTAVEVCMHHAATILYK